MIVEHQVPLQPHNSFGIVARARELLRVRSEDDLWALLAEPGRAADPKFVLGGGSNIVLTGDVKALVLKVEIPGMRVVEDGPRAVIVEAGAGVNWHALVTWTLDQGLPGLENLALIPGSVGAAPVQNVGAYGVELQDRFESLDAMHLATGQVFTLNAAQCAFGYRDSVFKHVPAKEGDFGLAGQALILRVRFRLPKPWKPELSYLDLQRKAAASQQQCEQAARDMQEVRAGADAARDELARRTEELRAAEGRVHALEGRARAARYVTSPDSCITPPCSHPAMSRRVFASSCLPILHAASAFLAPAYHLDKCTPPPPPISLICTHARGGGRGGESPG